MSKLYTVLARRWFERTNGNTYHAVRVTRHADGATIRTPMTYGYGDHYRQTALEAMDRAGWLPTEYSGDTRKRMSYDRENDYPIIWNVEDTGKRRMENV
jgi:hypothetical protein